MITGYFFLFHFTNPLGGQSTCIIKNVTGYPCPACGSTRATVHLFRGDLWQSIMINPFGLITNLLIVISIIWMAMDTMREKQSFFDFLRRDWDIRVKIFLAIVVIANWIWNIEKAL